MPGLKRGINADKFLAEPVEQHHPSPVRRGREELEHQRQIIRQQALYGLKARVAVQFVQARQRAPKPGIVPVAVPCKEQAAEMYHLLAIARYEDRFVVPTSGRENRDDVWAMKGSEGLAQGEMEERP